MTNEQIEQNKARFISLLSQVKRNGIDRLIDWFEKYDFFTAPASTKYHLSEDGGLCQHTLNVYDRLKAQADAGLVNLSDESVIITALCHDACKARFYEKKQLWRKGPDGKTWESYDSWVVNEVMPLGHGEKSCYIVQLFTWLSPEEYAMIRFHMGREGEGYNDYFTKAAGMYPGVIALHTADLEAAFIIEADKGAAEGK